MMPFTIRLTSPMSITMTITVGGIVEVIDPMPSLTTLVVLFSTVYNAFPASHVPSHIQSIGYTLNNAISRDLSLILSADIFPLCQLPANILFIVKMS